MPSSLMKEAYNEYRHSLSVVHGSTVVCYQVAYIVFKVPFYRHNYFIALLRNQYRYLGPRLIFI